MDSKLASNEIALLANGYLVLALITLAGCGGFLWDPEKFAASAIGVAPLLPAEVGVSRIYGALTLIYAALLYCLKTAAENHHMGSGTWKRLAWSLCLAETTGLAIVFTHSPGLTTSMLPPTIVYTASLLVFFWKAYKEIPILSILPDTLSSVKATFSPKNSWKATVYSILTVDKTLFWIALIAAPRQVILFLCGSTEAVGPYGVMLLRLMGVSVFLMSVAMFTLKNAAESGDLGARGFKLMNLAGGVGCGLNVGIALFHRAVFASAVEMSLFAGHEAVVALICLSFYLREREEIGLRKPKGM